METGLVYNQAFNPSLLVYDENYQNEQACSDVFKRHLDDVARIMARHFLGKSIVEIGCGKGFFLEHLSQLGFNIVGVDPAYEGDNPNIIKAYFNPELSLSAEVISLRHVLEHIPNPLVFLTDLAQSNNHRGIVYIEVPCFDWICSHGAWFDIYYEHVNYFRLQDFFRIFGNIYDSGHFFGGHYIYIIADLGSLRRPVCDIAACFTMPSNFTASLERSVDLSRSYEQRRNVIWGAASKGVIFAINMLRAGCHIDAVIDINPVKQELYLPITGLRVSSPENAFRWMSALDNVFVMNSNYLSEIVELSNNKYTYITVDHE